MIENQSILHYADKSILISFIDLCEETEKLLETVWKSIVVGNIEHGIKDLPNLFNLIDQGIKAIYDLNEQLNITFRTENFLNKLHEFEKAFMIPDYVLTADIIKFELKVEVFKWRKESQKLLKQGWPVH